MKTTRKKAILYGLASLFLTPSLVWASETRTYTGATSLPTITIGFFSFPSSFAPTNSASISGNTITIDYDSTNLANVAPNNVLGAYSDSDTVSSNTVNISRGTIGTIGTINGNGFIEGGFSDSGNVINNRVSVSGGVINGCVEGGWSVHGDATGNTVTITGGIINTGDNYIDGGWSTVGKATKNSVTVSGGTINCPIYGGVAQYGTTATGNTVTITGGTINNVIVGGCTVTVVSGNATNNTVTIAGTPTLTNAILQGGANLSGSVSGDYWTGNTLNVKNSGMRAQGVANFQYYNFYLPSTIAAGDTMLSVTTTANISNSSIGMYLQGGITLKPGDSINLLSSPALTATNIHTLAPTNFLVGIARTYNFSLSSNSTSLIATLSSITQNPQVKALSEGQASGAAMLNQGMNMLAGQGLAAARNAAASGSGESTSFAVLGGGSFSSDTGSHIDVNGFSLVAGAAKERKVGQNTWTSGLFLEHGWGNYSTYNSFTNVASVRGDGDTRYFGAGWLGRQQNSKGQYVEGSVRGGQINNNFTSNDIGAAGTTSSYDVSAPYYGLHIGIGKEANIGQNQKRDIYTKLLWTHQNGSSATVQGDQLQFDAVDSVRSQTGIKWSYKTNESTTMQIGLAYQHEFDGKADSTVNGSAIEAPSMKGNTGILAVGLTKENKNGKGPKLDIGLQGFCGKTKGVIGTTQASWNF